MLLVVSHEIEIVGTKKLFVVEIFVFRAVMKKSVAKCRHRSVVAAFFQSFYNSDVVEQVFHDGLDFVTDRLSYFQGSGADEKIVYLSKEENKALSVCSAVVQAGFVGGCIEVECVFQ